MDAFFFTFQEQLTRGPTSSGSPLVLSFVLAEDLSANVNFRMEGLAEPDFTEPNGKRKVCQRRDCLYRHLRLPRSPVLVGRGMPEVIIVPQALCPIPFIKMPLIGLKGSTDPGNGIRHIQQSIAGDRVSSFFPTSKNFRNGILSAGQCCYLFPVAWGHHKKRWNTYSWSQGTVPFDYTCRQSSD